MPLNNIDMSLDEIIKANKSGSKGNAKGKSVGKAGKSLQGTKRRQISKKPMNNRSPKGKASKAPLKGGRRGPTSGNRAATSVTKQLVQKLVKKALAQSNIGRNRTIGTPRSAQRKIRGGRIVKKTVVLNRLKMNPRSKVIGRQRVVQQKVVNVRRRPISFQQTYAVQQPIVRRVNYVNANARRPVILRQQPRTIIVQETRQPNFRRGNNFGNRGPPSIRQQINQMRQGFVAAPRVQMPRQQQVRVIRQTRFVQARPQRQQRQPRNNNFGNRGGQRKAQYDPMFEPPNFLQRIPSANSGGRRYVQF